MIDVRKALEGIPHFDKFCSVQELHELAGRLSADARFKVDTVGRSANGAPIHHVRFGSGSTKALFVAFPHCMEPIGGLTVYALMSSLLRGNEALLEADVEWHIVPCIDPDGAIKNERWSQERFTLDNFMRHFFMQAAPEQVDVSFPISYKELAVSEQSLPEGKALRKILDEVRPDFYFDLHNYCVVGGVFYLLSRDLGEQHYQQIYRFLDEMDFPLQPRPPLPQLAKFSEGVLEMNSIRKSYDFLKRTAPSTENQLAGASWDYLEQIKPEALTLVAESGLLQHPDDGSEKETGMNLRRFILGIEANSKYLASVLLDEWDNVKNEVDTSNPLYRAVMGGFVIPSRDNLLAGGVPISTELTRDILFDRRYDKDMTEGERFNVCMSEGGFRFLFLSYPLVQLLKESSPTPSIERAIKRLEGAYSEVLEELKRHIDFEAFKPINYDTLTRVQLGSGLLVLNSLLEARSKSGICTV